VRILWVYPGGLWPLNTGGRQRTFHTIAGLAQRHEVVIVTTHGAGDDPDAVEKHLPRCERVISVPYAAPKWGTPAFALTLLASWMSSRPVYLRKWRVPEVRRRVAELLETQHYDVVVADFLMAVANLPAQTAAPIVLFEHNVEYLIWKRLSDIESRWWRRLPLAIEWRKMRRAEEAACRRSDLTIAVSDVDRNELARLVPEARITATPTGVDTSYYHALGGPEVPSRLVFSGSMDWYPNEDAMGYLVRDLLPLVRQEIPDVSVTIVGRNPSPVVRALAATAGVFVTGTVDDVRPFLDEAAVYVVPLRVGGGTRMKIFEALAMSKAVISTTLGAEGLDITPDDHCVVADGDDSFARGIVSLLRNPARRSALGRSGRALVEARYSWPTVAASFESQLTALVQARRR
jgi:glycosyltransferase involved in cell wall biosynthesis